MKLKPTLIILGTITVVSLIGFAGFEYKRHLDSVELEKERRINMAKHEKNRQKLKEYMETFLLSEKEYSCIYIEERSNNTLSDRAASRLMKDRGGKFSIRSLDKGLEVEIQTDTKYIYKFANEAIDYVDEFSIIDQTVYEKVIPSSLSSHEIEQMVNNFMHNEPDREMEESSYVRIEGLGEGSISIRMSDYFGYQRAKLKCNGPL